MDKTEDNFWCIYSFTTVRQNHWIISASLKDPIVSTNTSLKDLLGYFGKLYSHFETLIIEQFAKTWAHKNYILRYRNLELLLFTRSRRIIHPHVPPLNNGH